MQAIFTGDVREWSEVPGAKIQGPIDLVDRIASSGTQAAFQDIFLGESLKISPSAEAEESNGLVQNKVKTDEDAIGFVSFAFTSGVNAVGYQGIPCTLQNAKSGPYQGVRNFWMVTKGAPKGAAPRSSSNGSSARKTLRPARSSTPSGSRSTDNPRSTGSPWRRPGDAFGHLLGSGMLKSPLSGRTFGHLLGGGAAAAERRTELLLRALAVGVLVVIAGIAITVFSKAWPSFSHNGFAWFGSGGDVDTQFKAMINGPRDPANYIYHFKAWPLIWATILTSGLAVIFGMVISILAAVFVVELAPGSHQARDRPDDQALGGGAVGRLRTDRDPCDRPLGRTQLHLPAAQALCGVRGAADRRQPERGCLDPDGDDRADHGGDHRRGA